jgi:hypothetical protein
MVYGAQFYHQRYDQVGWLATQMHSNASLNEGSSYDLQVKPSTSMYRLSVYFAYLVIIDCYMATYFSR